MEDNNSESSSKLEWEILDLYGSGKQTDVVNPRHVGLLYSNDNDLGISSKTSAVSESFHCPIKDAVSGFASYDDAVRTQNNTIMASESGAASSSGDQMINLRLGSQSGEISLSPSSNKTTSPSISQMMANNNSCSSTTPSKRSRASYQNMQNPCCQVEGCNLDLKSAKDYHRRHRICEMHSKSPKVVVGGLIRRFCQQCSRFHDLSEFDDKKRSCRKRLSDHNARRRRLPPESLHLSSSSAALSSALYDQRSHNIVLNGLSSSLSPNSEWQGNASTAYMLRQNRESSLIRPLKIGSGLEGTACFLSDEIPRSVSNLHVDSCERLCPFQSSRNTRAPDQSLHIGPGVSSVRSLLSSNSWYLNDAVSSSVMNNVSVANNNGSSETKQWPNNANVIAADQALMHSEEGTSSSTTHMQEHGSCFLFQPKGFF